MCLITGPILNEVGLGIPDNAPDMYSGGIGKNEMTPTWLVPVDIKIGRIERRNFRIGVTQHAQPIALLGRDFCRGLQYTIDDGNKTINFKRTDLPATQTIVAAAPVGANGSVTVSPTGTYLYNVPYTSSGTNILIKAQINGRSTTMLFDTGASVCFFSPQQANQVGIIVPNDAPVVGVQGVTGTTPSRLCVVRSMKVGPLEVKNVTCMVGAGTVSSVPMLGQSFFKNFQYTIDTQNKIIHFANVSAVLS